MTSNIVVAKMGGTIDFNTVYASPHWLRHTHASLALARGTELIMVRDNLRHASISTTSIYLHGDEVKRARQFDQAFGMPTR